MATAAVDLELERAEPGVLPPGPRLPALVQFLHLGFRPIAFLEECDRRYGTPFTLRVPARPPLVMFSDPEAIREIFTGDPELLRAGEANNLLEPMLGQHSLLLLDGPRHLRERRLMLPPFHGERMQAYGRIMREIADRSIDAWPVGRPFPIHDRMQAITLDVILRTVFGLDEGEVLDHLRERLRRLMAFVSGTLGVLLLMPWLQRDLGPLTPGGRFTRLAREIDDLLFAEIARRRAEGVAGRDDILSMLIAARDEDGQPMSDQELRDEMVTLLLAGHETTATSLAWAFHRVLGRPEVLGKLRAELRAVAVSRRLQAPMRIGGCDLPAGVVASPCIYLTHRRPDLWPSPALFDPERFVGARPNPYAFFPFGGGVRRCLGAAFATYEMKIVLAEILTRVELRAAPGYTVRTVRRTVTLAPSGGMPVVVERVAPARAR